MLFKSKKIKQDTQNLLLSIARQFIYVTPSEIDNTIHANMKFLTEYLNVERLYIYIYNEEENTLNLSHQYLKKDISEKISLHEEVDGEDFIWIMEYLHKKKAIPINDIEKIPVSAKTFKLICQAEKIKSMLICPLFSDKRLIGYIGADAVKKQRKWHEDEFFLLDYVGDIFTGAIKRKDSIESGAETEQKLRALFSRSEEVVFISSQKGKFIEINPAGVKLFGYDSVQELLSIDIKNDLYVNPEDYDKYLNEINKNEHVKEYELRLRKKDGTEIIVLVTGIVLRDKRGKIVSHEGIIRDITEKRQLEQQLFQSQKMESIGMLAGGIAHDFNNILTAMNGYAELVLMSLNEKDSNYKRVENIVKGGKQAEELVKQLLAFSRKQHYETKVCNINTIINDLDSIFKKVITEDIELIFDLRKGINYIKADPVQIQQIMVNLIANAGHAIKSKGPTAKEKRISISTDELFFNEKFIKNHPGSIPGKYICISISDTGTGIDKNTMDKIFDPFFTTKKEGKGTGLGLSTVYGIVKQNNAFIYVDSKETRGSTFNIYWPITKEKNTFDKKVETSLEFKQRCETILFVEDDQNVRQLAIDALLSFGYEVYEAENGKQALEIVENNKLLNKLDLLITDMVMPEMGGEELSQKIHKMNSKIKIILSSGYTNSQLILNKSTNSFYFLSKPYTIPKLEKKIRQVLQESQ